MNIKATQAVDGYTATKTIAPPSGATKEGAAGLAQNFADTLKSGEETALAALSGDADPQALVQALAETQLAVETAVTVRDRVVEAYQEILRMPV